jgi:hypothetical protein
MTRQLRAQRFPDGQRIITASQDKTARIWDVFPDTEALVSRGKADIPRCLTLKQRKGLSFLIGHTTFLSLQSCGHVRGIYWTA